MSETICAENHMWICIHSHLEISERNLTKNTKDMLMSHPILMRGRCILNKSRPIFLRNLVLTLNFQTLLVHICVNYSYHIWCQNEEEKLNFMIMQITNRKSLYILKKVTGNPGFLFCGTHCISTIQTFSI